MKIRIGERRGGIPAVIAIALGLLLGEAFTPQGKTAVADNWQLYGSNTGAYCEGCCGGGNLLCCSSSQKCRIYPT